MWRCPGGGLAPSHYNHLDRFPHSNSNSFTDFSRLGSLLCSRFWPIFLAKNPLLSKARPKSIFASPFIEKTYVKKKNPSLRRPKARLPCPQIPQLIGIGCSGLINASSYLLCFSACFYSRELLAGPSGGIFRLLWQASLSFGRQNPLTALEISRIGGFFSCKLAKIGSEP